MIGFAYSDELMGFVVASLFNDAITMDEFKEWCSRALALDGVPAFMIELVEFDKPLAQLFRTIGYVPHWPRSESDEYALIGIAFCRGFDPYDIPVTRRDALEHLAQSPHIRDRFSLVFGSIIPGEAAIAEEVFGRADKGLSEGL